MSRRISFFAKLHPGKRRVRFPDEIVFEESIKESDGEAVMEMLRRASLEIDVNRLNMAGITALHQAVLDENLVVIKLLVAHGADVNKVDVDSWTPLHAAAANGHHNIVRYLLNNGANRETETDEGETAEDLTDPEDIRTLAVLRQTPEEEELQRRLRLPGEKLEPPTWFRKLSLQEERRRESLQEEKYRGGERKGSAWVSGDIMEEEESGSSTEEEQEEEVRGQEEEEEREQQETQPEVKVWRSRRNGRLERDPPEFHLANRT